MAVSLSENWQTRWGKRWIGNTILTADLGAREIRAEAANEGTEADWTGNRTRQAGLRRK